MKFLNKTSFGFLWKFTAIVTGSIIIAFIVIYLSPEAQQERVLADLQEAYANDTYGGDTPEETLDLFIEALEAGDIELASKYFVVEKQEEIRDELAVGKNNNNLDFLISDLKKNNKSIRLSDINHRFRTFDENNIAEFSFDLILNQETGKWKMEDL